MHAHDFSHTGLGSYAAETAEVPTPEPRAAIPHLHRRVALPLLPPAAPRTWYPLQPACPHLAGRSCPLGLLHTPAVPHSAPPMVVVSARCIAAPLSTIWQLQRVAPACSATTLPSRALGPHAPGQPRASPWSPWVVPAHPPCTGHRASTVARCPRRCCATARAGAARKRRDLASGGTPHGRISGPAGSCASCLRQMKRRDRPSTAAHSTHGAARDLYLLSTKRLKKIGSRKLETDRKLATSFSF